MPNRLDRFAEKHFFRLAVAVVLFAALIRLLALNPFGVWFDEQCSLRGALGIFKSLPAMEAPTAGGPTHFVDFQPSFIHDQNKFENILPATLETDRSNGSFHNINLFAWIKTFGRSDVSVRLNTVFFSILTLIALIYFFSQIFSKTEALAAALLFATNPAFVKYGTQLRPYSFGTFWVALSTMLLYFIVIESKQKNARTVFYVAYFLTISATFFSHYLAAYILLAHLLFCAFYLRRLRSWLGFAVVAGLLSALFYLWLSFGAANAIKIMSEHNKLWATRQLEFGGFTFKQLFDETAKIIPKLFGLTTFGGSIESGSKLKFLYEIFKIVGSLTAVFVVYKYLRGKFKASNNVALNLLLITAGSCLIYSLYSSISSKHYLPFIDRYIIFAATLGTGVTAAVAVAFYRQTQSRVLRIVLVTAFATQVLTGLAKNSADIRRTKSYSWGNKNLFVDAAHKISQLDPTLIEVVYPTWNIATMTMVYLPEGLPINQRLVVTGDPKNIFVRNKSTGEVTFIEKNISDLIASWAVLSSELKSNDFTFVVVDDGSSDQTVSTFRTLKGGLPLEILEHGINKGPGAAFATGFGFLADRLKDGDLVVTMEGDNTSRIDTLSRMLLRQKTEDIDVVLASPFAYGGYIKTNLSGFRTVLSHVANAMVKVLLNLRGIHTFSSFFRVYKASAIKSLQAEFGKKVIYSTGFEGMVELLAKIVHLKLSASEVPLQLDWSMRKGKSKMKVVKTTLGYFKLFYILRTKPKPIGLQ